jgi:hypothetical protein
MPTLCSGCRPGRMPTCLTAGAAVLVTLAGFRFLLFFAGSERTGSAVVTVGSIDYFLAKRLASKPRAPPLELSWSW